MDVITALFRIGWVASYVTLITLAVFALPVTCYCGDQVPGPRALMVAADRIQTPEPTVDSSTFLPTSPSHQEQERPHLREMPTTLELGLGAIALTVIVGVGLVLPRPATPTGIIRFLLGLRTPPTTPPPRFMSLAA
jgi:hypothetical protein